MQSLKPPARTESQGSSLKPARPAGFVTGVMSLLQTRIKNQYPRKHRFRGCFCALHGVYGLFGRPCAFYSFSVNMWEWWVWRGFTWPPMALIMAS